ncbi:MAG: peptidylprolyl isomerase [Pseudomonadota bacterium]
MIGLKLDRAPNLVTLPRLTLPSLFAVGFVVAGFAAFGAHAVAQEPEAAPAPATEAAAEQVEDAVIATVNGDDVRYSDVVLAERDLGAQLSGVPEEVKFEYLANLIVDRKALATAARADGLEDDPEVKRQMDYYAEKVLADVYLNRSLLDAVSDEEAKAYYDKQISEVEVQEEVSARHILVETEEAALAVIERINAGEDFVELAKEVSTGPSGKDGGDLGYFVKDRMVPEFSTAAFALDPGQVSAPVKSDFGWHVIKVEDRRMQQLVAFEDVKESIKVQLRDEKAAPFIDSVRAKADIKFTGEDEAGARPQIVPQQ